MEEISIKVKKLNIFQQLRINFVKRQLSNRKLSIIDFNRMPDYIKSNKSVLQMLVYHSNFSNDDLRKIKPEFICSVKQDLEFLEGFSSNQIHTVLKNKIINPYIYSEEERKKLLKELIEAGQANSLQDIEWGYMPEFENKIYSEFIQEGKINEAISMLQYLDKNILSNIINEDPQKIQFLTLQQQKFYSEKLKNKLGNMLSTDDKYNYVSKRMSAFQYLDSVSKTKIIKLCFENGVYDIWSEVGKNYESFILYMDEIECLLKTDGNKEIIKEIAKFIPPKETAIMISNRNLIENAKVLINNLTESQMAEFFDSGRLFISRYENDLELGTILAKYEKYGCIDYLKEENRKALINKFNKCDLEEKRKHAKEDLRLIKYLPPEEQSKLIGKDLKKLKYCTIEGKKAYIKQNPLDFLNIDEESMVQLTAEDIRLYEALPEKVKKKVAVDLDKAEHGKIFAELLKKDIRQSKNFCIEDNLSNGIDYTLKELLKQSKDLDDDTVTSYVLHSKLLSAIGKLSRPTDILHGLTAGEEILGIDGYTSKQLEIIQNINQSAIIKLVSIDSNYVLPYLAGSKEINRQTPEESLESQKRACELFTSLYGKEMYKEYLDCFKIIYDLEEEYSKNDREIEYKQGLKMIEDFKKYQYHMDIPLEEFKILFNPNIIKKCNSIIVKQYFEKLKKHEETKPLFEKIIKDAYGERAEKIVKSRSRLNVHSINSLEVFDNRILDTYGEGFVHDCISYNIRNFSEFLEIVKNPEKNELFRNYYQILSNVLGNNVETIQKSITEFSYVNDLLKDIKDVDLSNEQVMKLLNVLCSEKNQLNIDSINDLDNFSELAKQDLEQIIYKSDNFSIDEIKSKICENILGVQYNNNRNRGYGISLEEITKLYDISEGESSKDEYTKEEKRLLEIMNFIREEAYEENLVTFIKNLENITSIRNYAGIINLISKVKEKELSEMNSHITTIDKLDRICEVQKDEEIPTAYKEEINGVSIYHFNGEPFCMFSHDSGNTSLEDLLGFEGQGGNTAICTRLITPEIGTMVNKYLYGAIPNEGLIAINEGDACTQHIAKRTKMTANINHDVTNINKIESSGNEVAMYRRQREHSNITNENLGGNIRPMAYGINDNFENIKYYVNKFKGTGIAIFVIHPKAYREKPQEIERKENTEIKEEDSRI